MTVLLYANGLQVAIGDVEEDTPTYLLPELLKTKAIDSSYLILDEVEGGFAIVFIFYNVPANVSHVRVLFDGRYDGNVAHEVRLYVTKNLVRESMLLIPSTGTDQSYSTIDLGEGYISSTNTVRVTLIHLDAGDVGDKLYVDRIALEDRTAEHAAVTVAPVVDVDSIHDAISDPQIGRAS